MQIWTNYRHIRPNERFESAPLGAYTYICIYNTGTLQSSYLFQFDLRCAIRREQAWLVFSSFRFLSQPNPNLCSLSLSYFTWEKQKQNKTRVSRNQLADGVAVTQLVRWQMFYRVCYQCVTSRASSIHGMLLTQCRSILLVKCKTDVPLGIINAFERKKGREHPFSLISLASHESSMELLADRNNELKVGFQLIQLSKSVKVCCVFIGES